MEDLPNDSRPQEQSLTGGLTRDWWKLLVLLTFAVLAAITIASHEPWHDEIQSWLLARDTNPITLLFKFLRYEGHPGLWHLLLMIPAKLKLPLLTMNLIAGAAMVGAVYLILYRSHFPTIVKVLLPFSYFFLYQYSVIARSYSLIPLLLFLIALIYRRRNERPYTYFVLLILLANVSLHGTIMALALLALHMIDLRRKWYTLVRKNQRKQIVGLVVFALVLLFLVVILWPPLDIKSPAKYDFGPANVFRVGYQALDVSLISYWYVSFPLLVLLLLWLYQRRMLFFYLVITVPLLLFFAVVYSSIWHFGILFIVLIFVLWLSFDEDAQLPRRRLRLSKFPLRQIAIVSLVLILVIQIFYSVQAIRAEFRERYSSSYELSIFIKENHLENKKIDMVGIQTPVLAYFDRNIFYNYNDGRGPCFWLYSKKNNYIADINKTNLEKVIADNPDYIIAGYAGMSKLGFEITGYKTIVVFPGLMIWENHLGDADSSIVYQKVQP